MLNEIKSSAAKLTEQLIAVSGIGKGDILVVGCSSSEIVGAVIGHGSSLEAAEAVFEGINSVTSRYGIYLAAQCCEHLNRAIVVERDCAEQYRLDQVTVMPIPSAGGSFASTAYRRFEHPVVVEAIKAHAGIDVGDTLIGMHLRPVAVPVRLDVKQLGEARVVCARTRPKLIGGIRAQYPEDIR